MKLIEIITEDGKLALVRPDHIVSVSKHYNLPEEKDIDLSIVVTTKFHFLTTETIESLGKRINESITT